MTRRSPHLVHRAPIRFHTGTVEVRGQLLLLETFGGGFTWGSALIRY